MDTKKHKYRAAWRPPVALSPHDSKIIYYGTNMLMRSNDRGHTWVEISHDLTTNNKAHQGIMGGPITNELDADAYNTIFYIVESPHEAGTIWVGSDDGLVHLTRDGGKNWENVTPSGVDEVFINAIEVSPHNSAKAYIVVDGHRSNDFTPSIYKTENYGRKWSKIVRGLPEDTFARVVREDPKRSGLLYAGTESGVFVSFNDGSNWQSLQLNLPKTPVTDLKLRQGDLVASTEGSGFWILGNPAPLRQLKASLEDAELHVFKPVDAYRIPNGGAIIYYYLKDDPGKDAEKVIFEILDNSGKVIRTVKADPERNKCMNSNSDIRRPARRAKNIKAKSGLNRWSWNLRRDNFRCINNMKLFIGLRGARVIPGDYQIRITVGEYSQTRSFKVLPDPRDDITAAQFAQLDAHLTEAASILSGLIIRLDRLRMARDQVVTLAGLTKDHERHQEIKVSADSIVARVADWEAKVSQPKHETVEDEINYPNMLDAQVMYLLQSSDRADAPVGAGARARLIDLKAEWDAVVTEYDRISQEDITAFNRILKQADIDPVVSPKLKRRD